MLQEEQKFFPLNLWIWILLRICWIRTYFRQIKVKAEQRSEKGYRRIDPVLTGQKWSRIIAQEQVRIRILDLQYEFTGDMILGPE